MSKVVISKETPLHDPAKVYRAAIESAKVPGRPGRRSTRSPRACTSTRPATPTCTGGSTRRTARWTAGSRPRLFLYEHARGDEEFADRIVRFWAGDPLPVADLRRRLKEAGAAATYRLAAIKERDLSRQRFRFVSRLMQAAGHGGWVVLLDEVELIGRYTSLQRAKSYAEIARWVRGDRDDPAAPIVRRADDRRRLRDPGAGGQERQRAHPQAAAGQGHGRGRAAGRSGGGRACGSSNANRCRCSPRPGRAGPHLRAAQADPRRGIRLGSARRGRPRAAAVQPDAPVRAGLDQRVGSAPARPRLPARDQRAGLDVDLSRTATSRGATRRAEPCWRTTSPPPCRPRPGSTAAELAERLGRAGAGGVVRPVRRPRPVPARPRVPAAVVAGVRLPGQRPARAAGVGVRRSRRSSFLAACTRGRWKRSTRGDAEVAGAWWRRSPARARRWWAWPPRSTSSAAAARSLVLVPTVELQHQWVAELEPRLPAGRRVGRMGAGAGDTLVTHDVLVAVVNSARAVDVRPIRAGWAARRRRVPPLRERGQPAGPRCPVPAPARPQRHLRPRRRRQPGLAGPLLRWHLLPAGLRPCGGRRGHRPLHRDHGRGGVPARRSRACYDELTAACGACGPG